MAANAGDIYLVNLILITDFLQRERLWEDGCLFDINFRFVFSLQFFIFSLHAVKNGYFSSYLQDFGVPLLIFFFVGVEKEYFNSCECCAF